jgi:hypothetical protein
VRVVGEEGNLLGACTPEEAQRYLTAPNAEVKRRQDGSIRWIRLRSLADDRGHSGENHGRSTVTTERVRNDSGVLIGSDINVKHKAICSAWAYPDLDKRSTQHS